MNFLPAPRATHADCSLSSSASDAISSIAAARSSTPLDCSVAAVAASREAALASSAADAICRAALVISVVDPRMLPAPSRMDLLAVPRAATSFACLLQRRRHRTVVLNFDLRGHNDLLEITLQRRDLVENSPNRIARTIDVLRRFASETANVVRYHCETAARLSRSRRFDGATDGEHAGLNCYQCDRLDDFFDLSAYRLQSLDRQRH